MSGLTTMQRLRLYEAIGNIAESLPVDKRLDFYRTCRHRASGAATNDAARRRMAIVRKHMSDLVVNDWRWVGAVLPDEGGWHTLHRWAEDAGYIRASSS